MGDAPDQTVVVCGGMLDVSDDCELPKGRVEEKTGVRFGE